MINKPYSSGFTLIELAIVLVIIGVLIGSFIGTLTTRIENARIVETNDELEEIKQALIGYAYRNGHLPCPDCIGPLCNPPGFRDGIEDRSGDAGVNCPAVPAGSCCTGNLPGSIPWVTLGMGRGDAWNTRYRYWVHETFSRNGTNADPNKRLFDLSDPQVPADADNPLMAQILDRTDDGLGTQPIADNIVAVVLSPGRNRYAGFSVDGIFVGGIPASNVDEIENIDNDVADPTADPMIFISRPPTTEDAPTAGGEFDDILVWISEFELKAKMVEAGKLP